MDGRGRHPNSLANLQPPWQPGESGNPNGRPPKRSLRELIEDELDLPSEKLEGATRREELAALIVEKALAGNMKMLEEALKRLWPAKQIFEIDQTEPLQLDMESANTPEKLAECIEILMDSGIIPASPGLASEPEEETKH